MAGDSKRPPSSRFERALAMGLRVGVRARRLIQERVAAEPSVPSEPVSVTFEVARGGKPPIEGQAPGGISLLAAAARLGAEVDHFCGGQCSCGTCRLEILEGAENLSKQDGMEQMVLGSSNVAAGNRLACQARILGPVRVRIPQWF